MPDVPEEPHRRSSRGPAAGRLWSGEAGPEAPPPSAYEPQPRPDTRLFGEREQPEAPTVVLDEPKTEKRRRVWPAAVGGGATAGLAVAAAAFAIGGGFDGDNASDDPVSVAQPPAVVQSNGAKNSSSVGSIYAAASPAVASIQTGEGSGTGFLIENDGTLVTNAHVVGESSSVRVKFGDDGKTVTGTVVGKDTSTDLAVVRVDKSDINGIRPLQWANSDGVKVGDLAVAIGNPLGLPQTATAGIVSGLQREIQAPDGFQIDKVIQTDAPINPGNSGGPLLDDEAKVVGVNSQIATSGAGSGNIGIGFAVPANTAKEVVPQLETGKTIERPWIGVSTQPSLGSGGGAQVAEIVPNSPAEKAGLKVGDVITEVDGKRVGKPDDVAAAISQKNPGDKVSVEVQGGATGTGGEGASRSVTVDLGNRPK
jgi:putative serine protease PepD